MSEQVPQTEQETRQQKPRKPRLNQTGSGILLTEAPAPPTPEEIARVVGFFLAGGVRSVTEKAAAGQIVFQCHLSLSFPDEEPYVIEDTIRMHGILDERNATEAINDFDLALRRVLKPLQNRVLARLAPVVETIPETGSVFEGNWPVPAGGARLGMNQNND